MEVHFYIIEELLQVRAVDAKSHKTDTALGMQDDLIRLRGEKVLRLRKVITNSNNRLPAV